MPYRCPVCGYPDLNAPPRYKGAPSDEICFSCGYQFGFHDDDRGISYEVWRADWIEAGMPWRGHGRAAPTGWDPVAQLGTLEASGGET